MIWLIGSGQMAESYIEVLKKMEVEFLVIGRGEASATNIEAKHGVKVVKGGLDNFLKSQPSKSSHAIISVGVEQLYSCCSLLLNYGIQNILTEKPGALNLQEIGELAKLNKKNKANVSIAYNRRFYSSVLKAEEIIAQDGGILSFNFEFTEWSHIIEKAEKPREVFENWIMANSSHVIDLAFYLGGWPKTLNCLSKGKNTLGWHPSSAIFVGSGESDKGALFSYSSNWISPGRWVVEVMTPKHRLYFKPMEQLQIQNIGSVKVDPLEIDNSLDISFKPGLYLQTQAFLEGSLQRFCTLEEQVHHFDTFNKIRG